MAGHHYGWSRGSNYCGRLYALPLYGRVYIHLSKDFHGHTEREREGERSELFITKGDHRCFASANANVSRNFLRVVIIISILYDLSLSFSCPFLPLDSREIWGKTEGIVFSFFFFFVAKKRKDVVERRRLYCKFC